MELLKSIRNRRSTRNFIESDISNETVFDLLDCARLAPSAKNRQPWKFKVLRGSSKDNIADIMLDNSGTIGSVLGTANAIKKSSVLILVFKEFDDNWTEGDLLSIGASVQNILLRATDLGLGSLWIRDTVYTKNIIEKIVNEEGLDLVCAVAIGGQNNCGKRAIKKEFKDIIL